MIFSWAFFNSLLSCHFDWMIQKKNFLSRKIPEEKRSVGDSQEYVTICHPKGASTFGTQFSLTWWREKSENDQDKSRGKGQNPAKNGAHPAKKKIKDKHSSKVNKTFWIFAPFYLMVLDRNLSKLLVNKAKND